jgi:hypothetical protein
VGQQLLCVNKAYSSNSYPSAQQQPQGSQVIPMRVVLFDKRYTILMLAEKLLTSAHLRVHWEVNADLDDHYSAASS